MDNEYIVRFEKLIYHIFDSTLKDNFCKKDLPEWNNHTISHHDAVYLLRPWNNDDWFLDFEFTLDIDINQSRYKVKIDRKSEMDYASEIVLFCNILIDTNNMLEFLYKLRYHSYNGGDEYGFIVSAEDNVELDELCFELENL